MTSSLSRRCVCMCACGSDDTLLSIMTGHFTALRVVYKFSSPTPRTSPISLLPPLSPPASLSSPSLSSPLSLQLDLGSFLTLTEDDLIDLCITDGNDRQRLLALIRRLQHRNVTRSPVEHNGARPNGSAPGMLLNAMYNYIYYRKFIFHKLICLFFLFFSSSVLVPVTWDIF